MLRNRSSSPSRLGIDTPNGPRLVLIGDDGTPEDEPQTLQRPLRFAFVAAAVLLIFGVVAMRSQQPARAASAPLATFTTPEGVTINLYVNTVTTQQVYNWLLGAGLQDWTKLTRVDVVDTGSTMSTVGGNCLSTCTAAKASIQVTDDFLLSTPNYALAHEYGHVWSNYYKWTYWSGSWDAYLAARGLTGDPRIGSTSCWRADEMIAEDYRRLFGSGEARTLPECNRDIPLAENVPGLRDFLATTWTHGQPPPGYSGSGGISPTATPTLSATPQATATRTPSPSPTATATKAAAATATPSASPTPSATMPTPTKTPKGNGQNRSGGPAKQR